MHILLTNVHLDCIGGEGSSNSNASRDESVETGDESVETGDESIEAGEKTPQSCYNFAQQHRLNIACISAVRSYPIQTITNINHCCQSFDRISNEFVMSQKPPVVIRRNFPCNDNITFCVPRSL